MRKRIAALMTALVVLGGAAQAEEAVRITPVQESVPTDSTGTQRTLMRADFSSGQALYFLCR